MSGSKPIAVRASRARVPAPWQGDVACLLITERQLARRIGAMAEEIQRDFGSPDTVLISLLNGTYMFLADLTRRLQFPLRLDFMGVSSYGQGTESGELVLTKDLRMEIRGRDVLLLDDILDTGKTLSRVRARLELLSPRRLKTCVLLDKPARRVQAIEADYVGFRIPDLFVVGYGLDYADRYRNLPFIGVLKPEVYRPAAAPV